MREAMAEQTSRHGIRRMGGDMYVGWVNATASRAEYRPRAPKRCIMPQRAAINKLISIKWLLAIIEVTSCGERYKLNNDVGTDALKARVRLER